ncbi:MAG: 3-oxoacyl-ACP synthase [Alphaproteobacteria bacterium]|nr:3-oxoacyl-ACP synthase [Alphaproteobacteria bacterium]
MRDEDIDYSDIPALDDGFFKTARMVAAPGKKHLTIRLDEDVLEWLKSQGKGYQTRINSLLCQYIDAHQ